MTDLELLGKSLERTIKAMVASYRLRVKALRAKSPQLADVFSNRADGLFEALVAVERAFNGKHHVCPDCYRTFRSPQGLGMHRTWERMKENGLGWRGKGK